MDKNKYTYLCKVRSHKAYVLLENLLSDNDISIVAEGSNNFGYVVEVQECDYEKALKIIGDKCGLNFEWM